MTLRPPYALFGLVLFLVGCDSAGGSGPPGPRGPRGYPGDPAISAFTVDFFVDEAAINGTVASTTYDAPEVTPSVVQSGMVAAYVREQGTWTALPYTYGVESPDLPAVDYTVTLGYAFEVGFVELFFEVSTPVVFDLLSNRTVKFVVLSGSPAALSSINWNDYSAVASRFGLAE